MQKKQRTRSQKPSGRYFVIDALRGAALVAMFAYHFSFDLVYFRVATLGWIDDTQTDY